MGYLGTTKGTHDLWDLCELCELCELLSVALILYWQLRVNLVTTVKRKVYCGARVCKDSRDKNCFNTYYMR